MRMLLRQHWPAVMLAFLVGLVLVSGPLVAKVRSGVGFNHPVNIRIDDEFFYFARIKEVLDGHPTLGNVYLWEHKSKPPSPLFLGEWMLAQPIRFLEIGVVAGGVLYDFLFPAAAVLLTYGALYLVSRMRWLAFLGAAVLFFGFSPSEFARAVSPQFNFLFWLSQFLLSYLLITDAGDLRRRRLLAVLAAANLGLLFYLYPYYWTFYVFLFILAGLLFFFRGERAIAALFAAVIGGALFIAIPYFWMTFHAMQLPEYTETLRRISMIETHFPSGVAIVVPAFLLIGCAWFFIRRGILSWDRPTIFFMSGLITTIAVSNQHVITGRNFEFSSHYFMPAAFWFVFIFAYMLGKIRERGGRLWRIASVAGAAVAVVTIAFNLPRVTLAGPEPEALASARYISILEWIDRDAEPDTVVHAPSGLAELIPIYTRANVYFAAPVRLFLVPTAEVLDRFVIAHYFDDPFDDEFIRQHVREIYGVYAINRAAHRASENQVRSFFGLAPLEADSMPQELIEVVRARHRELRAEGFRRQLKRYRVDYVVWDRAVEPDVPYAEFPFLETVHEVEGFTVFRVR